MSSASIVAAVAVRRESGNSHEHDNGYVEVRSAQHWLKQTAGGQDAAISHPDSSCSVRRPKLGELAGKTREYGVKDGVNMVKGGDRGGDGGGRMGWGGERERERTRTHIK